MRGILFHMTKHGPARLSLAAGLLASAASLASAQSSGNFDRPLEKTVEVRGQAQPRSSSSTRIEMSQSDGSNTYKVSIVDDEVTAKANGEKLPPDRIRRSDGKIELLGKDGEVVATFHVGTKTGDNVQNELRRSWTMRSPAVPGLPTAPQAPAAMGQMNPPKAMAGITLADVPDSLAEHLGLKVGEGVMLERIVEGLPADKAGLKAKDIIIEAEGTKPLNQDKLREILRSKEPGQKVAVTVLRKGDKKEFAIELEKWDSEKLGAAMAPDVNIEPDVQQQWRLQFDGDDFNKKFEALRRDMPEEFKEHFNEDQIRKMLPHMQMFEGKDGQRMLMNIDPDQWEVFGQADPKAMNRLEVRIKSMEERLNALNQRLEKLTTLLEKQADRKEGGR